MSGLDSAYLVSRFSISNVSRQRDGMIFLCSKAFSKGFLTFHAVVGGFRYSAKLSYSHGQELMEALDRITMRANALCHARGRSVHRVRSHDPKNA